MLRLFRVLLCALPLLAVSACDLGGPTAPSIEDTTFAAGLDVDLSLMTKTSTGLYYRDREVGTGAVASAGAQVVVHYQGWLSDGRFVDSSIGRSPYAFVLGAGRVIEGWDEGVAGMRVGGKRQLVIPPSLGYGAAGSGGRVPPNAILVFEVELLSVG